VQQETFTRRYGLLRQGYCNAESDVHQAGQGETDSDPVQKVEASLNSHTMTPLSSWIMPMRPMGFKDDQCFRISDALSVTALGEKVRQVASAQNYTGPYRTLQYARRIAR
jgi:hypothetical protein